MTVWANVTGTGAVLKGQGLSVQEVTTGAYQVTVTDPVCSREINAPVVSVSDQAPGSYRVASSRLRGMKRHGANQQFMVYTGVVTSSMMVNPTNLTFDVLDTCG